MVEQKKRGIEEAAKKNELQEQELETTRKDIEKISNELIEREKDKHDLDVDV